MIHTYITIDKDLIVAQKGAKGPYRRRFIHLDTYMLEELSIIYHGITTKLDYKTAQLVIVTDTGYRLWYIDVDGIARSIFASHT